MFTIPGDILPDSVTILGIPFDDNSSFLKGSAGAPDRIREVLHNGSANLCSEDGVDIGRHPKIRDLGNLTLPAASEAFEYIEKAVRDLIDSGARVLSLGGDHSITYPVVKAYTGFYPGLNILLLDAHPDLYDKYDNNRFSHACPFARIMEEGRVGRLVQVGIRTLNPHLREQARRFNVEIVEMREWNRDLRFVFEGPVYLSVDMDVLDPAFAPGVSHHEPGGTTTRDLLHIIQNLDTTVVGADIVEFNPVRDVMDMTAMVAAKLTREICALLLAE